MDRLHHGGLDVEREGEQVRESVGALRRLSGQRGTGWLSPARSESDNTLDLVAADGIVRSHIMRHAGVWSATGAEIPAAREAQVRA